MPYPRGFWAYVTLLGLGGVGAVGSPFFVSKSLGADVAVLQSQMNTVNTTLQEIKEKLGPAVDYETFRLRTMGILRDVLTETSFKK